MLHEWPSEAEVGGMWGVFSMGEVACDGEL